MKDDMEGLQAVDGGDEGDAEAVAFGRGDGKGFARDGGDEESVL
jgi:hypothetical protein